MNLLLAVMLTWIPPAEREDGTPLLLSEIEEYRVYINDIPTFFIPGTETQYDLGDNVADGVRLKLTTFDTDGRESQLSNEAIVNQTPSAPVLICQ